MTNNPIKLFQELPGTIEAEMRQDLESYEASHGIMCDYHPFSLVMTTPHGETVGVLCAFTAFAEIYVQDLWVHSKFRAQGFGRQLLQALEDKFESKGYNNINLVTSDFQAPDFYEKCGYHKEFTRVNQHNPKLTKTFFVKFFQNASQTKGCLINK